MATVEGGALFYIVLKYGLKSTKRIDWDPECRSFCILHEVDGIHEDLTEQELATKTNIVNAIRKGAFFKE